MKSEKNCVVELILREHISLRVAAETSISALAKVKALYSEFTEKAEFTYESDSHITVEEPENDGYSYLDLRTGEYGFSSYDSKLF